MNVELIGKVVSQVVCKSMEMGQMSYINAALMTQSRPDSREDIAAA
jgi:hypothetical protein